MYNFFFPQALQNELSNKEPDLRLLLDKGQKMIENASPVSDVSDLSDRVEGIRDEWQSLKRALSDRDLRIREANKMADKFYSDADLLSAWLSLHEDKLNNFPSIG